MLNRMLTQQLKLNNSEAEMVYGKEATVWGAVTMQKKVLKGDFCLLLLRGKIYTEPLRVSL